MPTKKPYDIKKVKNVLKELFFDRWQKQGEHDLYKNALDPFSALIISAKNNLNLTEWKEAEKIRQIEKSEQNKIGTLHEELIACFNNFEKLKIGKIIDVANHTDKIIAEVKNKHNTTNASSELMVYDSIESALKKKEYQDYTAYYVQIISKDAGKYEKEFRPSDKDSEKDDKRRPANKKIILIDGISFYDLISGQDNTLEMLFEDIMKIISELMIEYGLSNNNFSAQEFKEIFDKTFFNK